MANIKTLPYDTCEPLRFGIGMGPNSVDGMLAQDKLTQEEVILSTEDFHDPENTDFFIEVWDTSLLPSRWVVIVSPEIPAVPFNRVYRRNL